MANISKRALKGIAPNGALAGMMAAVTNPWSEANPNGVVPMGLAENRLMHNEIAEYINRNFSITTEMLTYGDGPSGTVELRTALSAFYNRSFNPKEPILPEHVTTGAGATALLDALGFALADEGEGILISQPLYVGFIDDFNDRASVKVVLAPMKGDDPLGINGVVRHEEALLDAEKRGQKIQALMICNPHNPLGTCYSREVLESYMSLCSKYNIHLIVDEIYAKSIFPCRDLPDPVPFISIISLDISKFIDPSLVHVLYGMSKDFCANGLRVGAIISQHNPTLHRAISLTSRFSWASSLSEHAWVMMLNDSHFLDTYFNTLVARLTESYDMCTDLLRKWSVPYRPANCGQFIWIDLRAFIEEQTIEAERKLAGEMIRAGIWLATGETFGSETPGWFRITFAVPEESLRFGMERLSKALGIAR
ncbi:1-aminocyclopropane-1-carboxylate synthase-like protein 1 [Xylogone sp. PMI_703]|nr:1-aminocyclopropane-1-carboxylate synthase-like protein 1 [Xylogone sp. PMI_703]